MVPGVAIKLRKQVVVIGGGFGGLAATRALAREAVQVTLVDRRNHHLFQPLLYQVAMQQGRFVARQIGRRIDGHSTAVAGVPPGDSWPRPLY